jgi:hypothetical protein
VLASLGIVKAIFVFSIHPSRNCKNLCASLGRNRC